MKLTSRILLAIGIVLISGILSSNIILKKQYDAIDKSDVYWTYDKILQQPFKHLNIIGGNETNIFYEPSAKPSVRVLKEWVRYHGGEVKAAIRNDTLFLDFDYKPANNYEKFWMQKITPVRIFSPELLSVTGNNTHFEMQQLKQKTVTVNMSGKSKFEVESLVPDMDSINITQRDSTSVVFEMSPDYRKKDKDTGKNATTIIHLKHGGTFTSIKSPQQNAFDETMSINAVTANIKDYSILDIGHAQIEKLKANLADRSAIVLSGDALKKFANSVDKKQ
ncbi:MAG: hypothetical protein JWP81_5166 [Ferruginibacter sp.]|nr:hypothetical protein [Ferruginibacter sp.]